MPDARRRTEVKARKLNAPKPPCMNQYPRICSGCDVPFGCIDLSLLSECTSGATEAVLLFMIVYLESFGT